MRACVQWVDTKERGTCKVGRDNILALSRFVLCLSSVFVIGCGPRDKTAAMDLAEDEEGVDQVARVEPKWSAADMQVWHFAKERGVHGTDLSKRTFGAYELSLIRDLPEETPPIHAGPTARPELWVVREGDSLFEFDDPKMAPLLMTKDAKALATLFAGTLSWMGASDIHAITQTQSNGETIFSWIHNEHTYPSDVDQWIRVTVHASEHQTVRNSEHLKDYIRPQGG